MRFVPCVLAIFAVCAATVSGVRAEDAPDVKFKQTGKLNIGLAITKTEEKGRIRAEQDGRENVFVSDQGWTSNGPFQFSDEDLPLNKLNLYQMGEKSLAVSRQRGLNNDAVMIQNGQAGGSDKTEHHDASYSADELPGGGFSMELETGDVEIAAQYNIGGYRASSSFGRSH
jgi:hypothetical protein